MCFSNQVFNIRQTLQDHNLKIIGAKKCILLEFPDSESFCPQMRKIYPMRSLTSSGIVLRFHSFGYADRKLGIYIKYFGVCHRNIKKLFRFSRLFPVRNQICTRIDEAWSSDRRVISLSSASGCKGLNLTAVMRRDDALPLDNSVSECAAMRHKAATICGKLAQFCGKDRMADTTFMMNNDVVEELEALRRRLLELEEIEVMRVSDEQERFDSLQVLDEYAKQLEESRDKLTRLLRAGIAIQEARTVQNILQQIADAVGEAGWGSVSVSLFDNWEITQSAYCGVSDEDIEFLQNHRRPPGERARFYGPDFERFRMSRSYFVPAECLQEVISLNEVVPGRRAVQTGDTWDPMDLAYVPLYGSDGQVLGAVNCDDPVNGQRPNEEVFFYLELFADLAARKVETERLLENQQQIEEALRQSEEKYRTVFSRSADAFFLMDELFRDCNEQACRLWRCNYEDIVGHSPAEFSPEYQPDGRLSVEASLEYIHYAMAGNPQTFYWVHRCKDGVLLDCEVSLSAAKVGDETMVLANVRDVTERRRAERDRECMLGVLEIANSADRLENMIPRVFSELGKVLPVENGYFALYDVAEDAMSFPYSCGGLNASPLPQPLGRDLNAWVVRNKKPLRVDAAEYKSLKEAGEIVPSEKDPRVWLGVPLFSGSDVIGVLAVQSDRVEARFHKRHEQLLAAAAAQISVAVQRRRAEEMLRCTQFAVDRAADGIFWIGSDARFIYVNDQACQSLGYTREELLGMTIADIDPLYATRNWNETWQSLKEAGRVTVETMHRSKDGRRRPVEVTANFLEFGGKEMNFTFVRDLSARRRIEDEQRKLASLVENSLDYIAILSMRGQVVYVNDAGLRMVGLSALKDAPSLRSMDHLESAAESSVDDALQATIRLGHWSGELNLKHFHAGRSVPVQVHTFVLKNPDSEQVNAIAVMARDVSEIKRAETASRMSEESLRWLVENLDEAVGMVDVQEHFVYANPAMGTLLGVPYEDLSGRSLREFLDEKDFTFVREQTKNRQTGARNRYKVNLRRRDGVVRTVEIIATPQFDRAGKLRSVMAAVREISDRRNPV